jgi:BlaI family transcriptional regulator, penicillinase repressor
MRKYPHLPGGSMSRELQHGLSKRERQIMEAVYRLREASAADVQRAIPAPPGNSSVRTTLTILVQRRLLAARKQGRMLLYSPVISHQKARASAVRQLVRTYFDDSAAAAVSALLASHGGRISDKEYLQLARLIEESKNRERK